MDIDISLETKPEDIHTREQKIRISENITNICVDAILKINVLFKDTNILIFNSSSNEKKSFHIILDGFFVLNCRENREFFNQVVKLIPRDYLKYVDQTMFKSYQNFRLFMSTKVGKNRWKIFDSNLSKWNPEKNLNNYDMLRKIFFASLVGNVDNCKLISFGTSTIDAALNYDPIFLNEDEKNKVLELIQNMENANCFKISSSKSSLIILRRISSSYCRVCERKHDSENPYVYVYKNGDVIFDCRRNEEKKKLKLGNINDNETKEIEKETESNNLKQEEKKEQGPVEEKKTSCPVKSIYDTGYYKYKKSKNLMDILETIS